MKSISTEGSRLLMDWEASKDKNNEMAWCVAETCADIIRRIGDLERKVKDARPPDDSHEATSATQALVQKLLAKERELAEARADAERQASRRRWLGDSTAALADRFSEALTDALRLKDLAASLADRLSAGMGQAREALGKQEQK